jgi:hypothetical protein
MCSPKKLAENWPFWAQIAVFVIKMDRNNHFKVMLIFRQRLFKSSDHDIVF